MDPATVKLGDVTVSWEPEVAKQIQALIDAKKDPNRLRPFMVGVVGIPGSGKSTSSEILSNYLPKSIVMPFDGYHYPLSTLEKMPEPLDLKYRRGAPDTFDAPACLRDLERIANGNEIKITIPGFDHAVGDPTPDQHTFDRLQNDIVICEGIYICHDDHGWQDVKNLMDFIIFIHIDVDTSIARLKIRNKCIPGYTEEQIEIRCEEVDRVNAETVERSRHFANIEVLSGAA